MRDASSWRNTNSKVIDTDCKWSCDADCWLLGAWLGTAGWWPRARWSPASGPGFRVREVGPGPQPRPPHNQQQSRGRQWSCDHGRQGTSSSVQVTVVLTVELQTNFCEDFTIMEKAKATSRDGKGWTALRIYANQNRPSLMTIVLASQFLFTAC